jgi:hypothetical protein
MDPGSGPQYFCIKAALPETNLKASGSVNTPETQCGELTKAVASDCADLEP